MKKVEVSSPTRVDLAGGTLDLWPLFCFTRGASTVNLAVDIKTHASLEETSGEVILDSADLGKTLKYSSVKDALRDPEPHFELLRVVLREIKPDRGFILRTRSESPVGGGLGGSSSLMISMLKAFHLFLDRPLPDPGPLVNLAHNIEAQILNTPTGTQDYYPAVSGGLNILTYSNSGIRQEVLPIEDTPFAKKFLLVYTGKAHHSGLNNFEVLKAAVAKDKTVTAALIDLKQVADEMAQAIHRKAWGVLGDLFRREYQARIRLAPAFSCPEIEQLAKVATQSGAEAIKICGAGGGGCVMLWCPEGARETISKACQKEGFQILNASPAAPLPLGKKSDF